MCDQEIDGLGEVERLPYHLLYKSGPDSPGIDKQLRDHKRLVRYNHEINEFTPKPDPSMSTVKEQKVDKYLKIQQGILAAVMIANSNLLNMADRLAITHARNKDRNYMIMQSEAVSLMKGNLIRVFKTLYSSRAINYIKSR